MAGDSVACPPFAEPLGHLGDPAPVAGVAGEVVELVGVGVEVVELAFAGLRVLDVLPSVGRDVAAEEPRDGCESPDLGPGRPGAVLDGVVGELRGDGDL